MASFQAEIVFGYWDQGGFEEEKDEVTNHKCEQTTGSIFFEKWDSIKRVNRSRGWIGEAYKKKLKFKIYFFFFFELKI